MTDVLETNWVSLDTTGDVYDRDGDNRVWVDEEEQSERAAVDAVEFGF